MSGIQYLQQSIEIMLKATIHQMGLKKSHVILIFSVLVALIVASPFLIYLYFANSLKDKQSIINTNNQGVVLLDKDDNPFYSFNHPKSITYVSLNDISPFMRQAVVAAEDKNFYENPGFSITGMARALYANVTHGSFEQGGSTITQQLVKNAILNSNKNFLRKYQEVILAYELNRRYSKQDVLEMYLNAVYFGEGAFGIENAAQTYFGIPAKNLDLAQATLLTALLPAPSALSPISNDLAPAKKRQTIVLQKLIEDGSLNQSQADQVKAEALTFLPKEEEDTDIIAPHFALYVKDLLIKEYGEEYISRSGFTVKTTLNRKWQVYAEQVVRNHVANLRYDTVSNGAAVVIDPKNGEIAVMVGSEDWNNETFGKVNMVLTPRQPGSSFKPVIYADALAKKVITPATLLDDKPITYANGYTPQDFDRAYRGSVTVRRALANSLNIPAVAVMDKVSVPEGVTFAQSLGISTLSLSNDYGLPLILGTGEVKLLELTNAYATFANNGMKNQPTAILEITDKYKQKIYSYTPQPQNSVGKDVSFLISSILSDNTARAEEFGTALTLSRPAAVKTGTTENFHDALTIGYTPSLAVGVWVGNNDNTPMDNIAGSLGAAPIWRSLMERFSAGTAYETFQKPSSVVSQLVCPYANLSETSATSSSYTEFFLSGTETAYTCGQESPTFSPSPIETEAPTEDESPSPTTIQIPTKSPTPSEDTATPTPTQKIIPSILPTNPGVPIL